MWSYVYPDPDDPDEPDACSYCGRGELISTDEVDGNLRHQHMVDAGHLIYGAGGEKVTGNYDWEDGGIVRAEDTQFVVAVVNALPALLAALDTAERERDQALAALARIENGANSTGDEQKAAHLAWLGDGLVARTRRSTHAQIIAAAARLNIGGEHD